METADAMVGDGAPRSRVNRPGCVNQVRRIADGPGARTVSPGARIGPVSMPRVAVPFLLALGVVLRLHNLNESLWYDEVRYSIHETARHLWDFVARNPEPSAPLYPILTFLWVSLVGDAEWLVRVPSLACGLVSIVLTYFVARRFGRGAMPVLAAVTLCFSPVHIWYSQEAAPYAMTMFWVLVAAVVWPRVAASPSSGRWFAIYLTSLLGAVFTHYLAAFFIVPFTLLALRADARVRRTILIVHALVIVVLAGLLAQYDRNSLLSGAAFLRPFTIFEWWKLFFNWFLRGDSLSTAATLRDVLHEPGVLGLQVVFAAMLVWGLWPSRGKEQGTFSGELTLYLCAVPFLLWLSTLAGYEHLFVERYGLVALPFFAIALARGATRFSLPWLRVAAASALITVSIGSWASFVRKDTVWTVYKPNPDWRSTVKYLSSQNLPPDRLLLVGTAYMDDFAYYLRKEPSTRQLEIHEYDPHLLDRVTAERRVARIVLVENLYWRMDFGNTLAAFRQDPRVRPTTIESFKGVNVYTFVPIAADRHAE